MNSDGSVMQTNPLFLTLNNANRSKQHDSLLPFDFQLKDEALEKLKWERKLQKLAKKSDNTSIKHIQDGRTNFYNEENNYNPFDPKNVDISLSILNSEFENVHSPLPFDKCSKEYQDKVNILI